MELKMRMRSLVCAFILVLSTFTHVLAQDTAVIRGHFQSDSISIGKPVPYSLTARYPQTRQVLFPDSTYTFAPFELAKKQFFPTQTDNGISYDSVVYLLNTFEIDSVQYLQLPVFVLQGMDCVKIFSQPDSIFLQFRVASVPDSVSAEKLPLKINTLYQNVSWIFNYPVAAIVVASLLALAVVVWLVFGKRIKKYFKLRQLTRDYESFMGRFTPIISKLSAEFTDRKAEEALVVWKRYMEDLEKSPYTKYTSREIQRIVGDPSLDQALRTIDRGIYGGIVSNLEPFQFLQSYSQQRFRKKEEEVKHGKY